MKQTVTRTASFSLFFLLSGFALVHAQVPPPESTEPPSRLSMFAHDVSSWVDHIITDAKHITTDADHINTDANRVSTGADHRRASHSPPWPRLAAKPASAHVASNTEWSEFLPSPGASKKNTPTLVQIND